MAHAFSLRLASAEPRYRHPLRRRWNAGSRQDVDYYRGSVLARDHEISKRGRRSAELTRKEFENVANILQLQAENFFRKLELQSLQNSVAELVNERNTANEALHLFQAELGALEQGTTMEGAAALAYELSEQEWRDIIER